MVPGRTLFILVSLFFLIFVYCSSHTFGETHNDGSAESVVRRLAPGDELTDRKITLLGKVFQLPADFVKQRYSERFNKAMSVIPQGDFGPLAGIVAELFGTLNQQQFDSLLKTMTEEKEAELARTPPEPRFVSFLDKFILAANRIKDPTFTASDEEGVKFLQAFDPQFNRIKEANARFYEKLAQAQDGNRQAQEFLRTNYDAKGLLSFMDAQRTSGNKDLARSLAKSLAEKESTGDHSIDLNGAQGKRERLELGKTDEDVDFALEKFGAGPGFGGRTVSPTRHAQVDESFRFPRPAADPVAPVKDDAPPKVEPPKTVLPTVPPPREVIGSPPTLVSAKAAFDLMKANCVSCHGPGKRQFKAFPMNPDGSPKDSSADAITRILTRTLVDEDMPQSGPLEPADKAILRRWAADRNVAIPK